MNKQPSLGKCFLCGQHLSRTIMKRHLSACGLAEIGAPQSSGPSFHLLVEGSRAKAYWMHLAVPVNAPWSKLDGFLREIWLDCCGHLSDFRVQGETVSMSAPMRQQIGVSTKFVYYCDYGSTTKLALQVVAVRAQGTPKNAVQLLARNESPLITCSHCEQPATEICGGCAFGDSGWLCAACAETHSCGEEMLLPVTNSPRVGVCAYTG